MENLIKEQNKIIEECSPYLHVARNNLEEQRYEVRDMSKRIRTFVYEKEIEDFFFENNKKVFTEEEMEDLWIISSGRRGGWAIGAEDYFKKNKYFIPAESSPESLDKH